jgi:hypothetical protein
VGTFLEILDEVFHDTFGLEPFRRENVAEVVAPVEITSE